MIRTHGASCVMSAGNALTLSSTITSGAARSMISRSCGSQYVAPLINDAQTGSMKLDSCSIVGLRNSGAVSVMKSVQNCPAACSSSSSGGGARSMRSSSNPSGSSRPFHDASAANTTRCPRRSRTLTDPDAVVRRPVGALGHEQERHPLFGHPCLLVSVARAVCIPSEPLTRSDPFGRAQAAIVTMSGRWSERSLTRISKSENDTSGAIQIRSTLSPGKAGSRAVEAEGSPVPSHGAGTNERDGRPRPHLASHCDPDPRAWPRVDPGARGPPPGSSARADRAGRRHMVAEGPGRPSRELGGTCPPCARRLVPGGARTDRPSAPHPGADRRQPRRGRTEGRTIRARSAPQRGGHPRGAAGRDR